MIARIRSLLLCWAVLVLLLAAEFGANFLPLGRALRPLLLLPAIGMVAIVAFGFMGLAKGPNSAKIFAIAGLVWLIILLGLGSVDPLTRTLFLVQRQTLL